MQSDKFRLGLACAVLALTSAPALADEHRGGSNFKRIATLANYINNDDRGDETVSEIVAATKNGKTLVYTDSELEEIGFVYIGKPSDPIPTGKLAVPGEPTSVAVLGNTLALVAVNTSASFTDTSGKLVVVHINKRQIVGELELGGQPDSIAISPDNRYAAVAIENERDEEICVGGGENGSPVPEDGPESPGDITEAQCEAAGGAVGVLPQTGLGNPPGFLAIVDLKGRNPKNWSVREADLTGIAGYAPEDPEPEFVDIDDYNQAVVSLQENNHIAIVDLASGMVVSDFSAGTVDLNQVDTIEDDIISLTGSLTGVAREPDAIAWIDGYIGTANEGDLFGGSRGFSIFSADGSVKFDAGNSYDHLAVQVGHYPEGRSENKGSEPESIEFARFDGKAYVFVGSERGSFIAVYEIGEDGMPSFKQVLPGPLGPEGLLAIPKRNLLVVSGEDDDPEFGVRSSIMIYEYGDEGRRTYPQVRSRLAMDGTPIPHSALSGMDALPSGELLAVWDSFYADSRIFTILPRRNQAVVTGSLEITGASDLDPEGIAVAPDGSYWVASEGSRTDSRENRLLQVNAEGTVMNEVFLPDEIRNCRAAERALGDAGNFRTHNAGFEGVAVFEDEGDYVLLVAQQRGWDYTTTDCEALDDDPDGSNPSEPGQTRIWIYSPTADAWDSVPWELADVPENASWAGLSEITRTPDGDYVIIERDNRTGDFAELKTLVKIDADDLFDGVTADEKTVVDIVPALEATNGWITDKPEGTAITSDGSVFIVTDNDGVDDWSGETWFLPLGDVDDLFDNRD